MLDLSDNLIRKIGLLYRYMMRAIDSEMAALDIGAGRFSYLFMLYLGEGLTQQEMAYRLQADKAAIARTLAQLEQQGFVERRPDERDRRVVRVYLTERSRALRGTLEAAVTQVISRMKGDTEDPTLQLVELQLSTMLQRLDGHYQFAQKSQLGQKSLSGQTSVGLQEPVNSNATANPERSAVKGGSGRTPG